MCKYFWGLLFCIGLSAANQPSNNISPQQIERELQSAELQYKRAKEMFNPWYTGPLVTPAASMMPPGYANLQPYLFFGGTYANYNQDRKSVSIPHNLYSLQLSPIMFVGITNSVDFSFTLSATANWQNHKTGGGFNDLSGTIGFCITNESLYVPALKFTITETFPTGKYKKLSTNGLGLNATGEGSYQTQFGLGMSKVIWWLYKHPLNLRYFVGYTIGTPVRVKEFNTYGGGFGTRGVVHPGHLFTSDLGIEWSFSQRWVIATDIVYQLQNQTKFHGNPGVLATGAPAAVGSGYNDNLSLAPALEYNWNPNLGIIWGMQFSVYGRSSPDFLKGMFSVTYTWGS